MNNQQVQSDEIAKAVEAVLTALEKSDRREAIHLARMSLEGGLVHPLFLNLRAFWLESRGRLNEALKDLERARELAPQDVPVLNALGLLLARLQRPVEATQAFEKAKTLQPDFVPAHFNHGWACEMWGEIDRAKKSYETALALSNGHPGAVEPLARLASLAQRSGDWDKGRKLAAEALQLSPAHPIALLTQARVETQAGRHQEAEGYLFQVLKAPNLSRFDRYWAMGSLGDLRHAQGRYAEAFRIYAEGNEDYRRGAPDELRTHETAIDVLRWTRAHYEKITATAPPAQSPPWVPAESSCHTFLIGFIRSGTTLLEQALASHPGVVTMEEKEAFDDSGPQYLNDASGLNRLHALPPEERRKYAQAYWRRVREQGFEPGGNVFIDKQPFNVMKLPLIAEIFPGSKIVFALRDPRDVILSSMRRRLMVNALTYPLLSLETAAPFYDAYMQLADRLKQVLPLHFHYIRHEDVVDDFEGEVRKVCDFLGIEWSESIRNFAERREARTISSPSAAQIARGLNREGVGQWRNYREQLAPILPVLQPWVERYGYAAD